MGSWNVAEQLTCRPPWCIMGLDAGFVENAQIGWDSGLPNFLGAVSPLVECHEHVDYANRWAGEDPMKDVSLDDPKRLVERGYDTVALDYARLERE